MKLVQILRDSVNIQQFKKELSNLEDHELTIEELKEIDKEIIEKNYPRERALNVYIAIGHWYSSTPKNRKIWKKIKSSLLKDTEISATTKDYLAILG